MLIKLFKWIFRLFAGRQPEKSGVNPSYKFDYMEDVPLKPANKTIYIIGEQGYYWQFVMLCPCNCGSLLHMNLMNDHKPFWSYEIVNNEISFTPSIDRMVGCKSHFFIKNSKIVWA